VLVEADRGLDVGRVTEIYPEIMDISFVKKILSLASPEEVQHSILKEKDEKIATDMCRSLASRRGLRISIVDAEYQFDRKKLTFFFISDR
jgi:cell fate regulator YaaT (PSP1 superfamily)